jgi:hypothetical protein
MWEMLSVIHPQPNFPKRMPPASFSARLVAPLLIRFLALTAMGPERPRCNGAEEEEQRLAFTELRRGVSANPGRSRYRTPRAVSLVS